MRQTAETDARAGMVVPVSPGVGARGRVVGVVVEGG